MEEAHTLSNSKDGTGIATNAVICRQWKGVAPVEVRGVTQTRHICPRNAMCNYAIVEELVTILLSIPLHIRGGIIRAIQRTYSKIMY